MSHDTFMGHVQLHERAWGTDNYKGRPSLDEILSARIVCFWRVRYSDPGYQITLHESPSEIHKYASDLVLHNRTRPPERRIAKLFVEKEQWVIKGVKVIAEPAAKSRLEK